MIANKIFYEIILYLFIVIWLFTVFFTLTVLIIIISHWRTHFQSTINLLVCNTCVALLVFLIASFLQIPSFIQEIYYDIPPPSPYNSFICQMYACLVTFSTALESFSFLIQAISCFFITILYKHKYLLTYRTNWIMIIISWIISAIIAGGLLISPLAYYYEPKSHFCTLSTKNFLTAFVTNILIGTIPMIIITVLYGIILYDTAHRTRMNPNSASTLRAKRNKAIFKRILLLVNIFSIGGTIYMLCVLLDLVNRTPWQLYSLAFIFLSLAFLINSIALLVTDDQVKKIFLAKLAGHTTNTLNTIRLKTRNRTVHPLPPVC